MKATTTHTQVLSRYNFIENDFKEFILEKNHPCIMANTVFSMNNYELHIYDKLGTKQTAKKMLEALNDYIDSYDFSDNNFKTFIAVFPEVEIISEIEFENLLWRQLQFLNDYDTAAWDPQVSNDPTHKNFSFSIGGRAFYRLCII